VDLGDVTGDNALDIVVSTNYCCPDVSHLAVLPGGGDGTFEPWVPVFLCADGTSDVALADINGDTKLDIVTACYAQLCISINDGSGTFSGFPSVPTKAGVTPSLVVGDLDRDGKADLAAALSDWYGQIDDSVYVYKGNGDGTFQSHAAYDVSEMPVDLALGDLNGDGQFDLVTASPVTLQFASSDPGYLSVLINCIPCGTTAIAVALQDVRVEAGLVRLEWIVPDAGTSINSVQRRTIDSDWVDLGQGTAGPRGTVTFEDHDVTAGTRYAYRLFVLNARDQGYSSEAWITVPGAAPLALRLEPAYPNPFRAETRLTFTVPGNGRAALAIYDVKGRRIAKLLDEDMPAGGRSLSWNGMDNSGHAMASGTYFAKLSAGGKSLVRKVLLTR
jgi:hypothetical protein